MTLKKIKNMNSKNDLGNINKEKIFLCKKVNKSKSLKSPIFYIDKVKKIGKEVEQSDYTLDSTIYLENKKNKITSIDEIEIPSFFNDIIIKKEEKVEQRLRKYSEASTQFNDIEDAEVYLIKKESLFIEKDENI
jgi:hypothetical protein